MGEGLAVWLLHAPQGFGDARFHAHHAIQLTVAIDGAIAIDAPTISLAGTSAAVAADASHRMTGAGLFAIVFVDPDGGLGRALTASLLADEQLVALPEQALRAAFADLSSGFEVLSQEDLLAAGRRMIDCLLPAWRNPPSDPRIDMVLVHLRDHPDDTLVSAAEAQRVFLSHERLRHLFVEQTGLPHKSYVLWLRMTNALRAYSQGATLTEAAHSAGFADSAHLSRAFRRTFGLPATTLTRI